MILKCEIINSPKELLFGTIEDLKNFFDDDVTSEELNNNGFRIYGISQVGLVSGMFEGKGIDAANFWIRTLEDIRLEEETLM